jgi:hypothetical protein
VEYRKVCHRFLVFVRDAVFATSLLRGSLQRPAGSRKVPPVRCNWLNFQ